MGSSAASTAAKRSAGPESTAGRPACPNSRSPGQTAPRFLQRKPISAGRPASRIVIALRNPSGSLRAGQGRGALAGEHGPDPARATRIVKTADNKFALQPGRELLVDVAELREHPFEASTASIQRNRAA